MKKDSKAPKQQGAIQEIRESVSHAQVALQQQQSLPQTAPGISRVSNSQGYCQPSNPLLMQPWNNPATQVFAANSNHLLQSLNGLLQLDGSSNNNNVLQQQLANLAPAAAVNPASMLQPWLPQSSRIVQQQQRQEQPRSLDTITMPQIPQSQVAQGGGLAGANSIPIKKDQNIRDTNNTNHNFQDSKDTTRPVQKKNIPSGARVKSCRARGMSADHNSRTAYFVIRGDTTHGEELLCSHMLCRQKGPRFRFCRVCNVPVAKQTFATRHLHPEIVRNPLQHQNAAASTNKGCGTESDESSYADNQNIGKRGENIPVDLAFEIGVTKKRKKSTKAVERKSKKRKKSKRKHRMERSSKNNVVDKTENKSKTGTPVEACGTRKEWKYDPWMSLLGTRPRTADDPSGDRMSAWLMKVLSVSEEAKADDKK